MLSQLFTFSWPHLLIAFGLMLILNVGSIRDGVNGRPEGLGWLKFHLLIWLSRDIACAIIMMAGLADEPRMWWAYLGAAVSHTWHEHLYSWGTRNLRRFAGIPNAPEWFRKARELYRRVIFWV